MRLDMMMMMMMYATIRAKFSKKEERTLETNGRPEEERLAAFLQEHPDGYLVIAAGNESAFSGEIRDNPDRYRIVMSKTTRSDIVDRAVCLVICRNYAPHQPGKRLKERAKQVNVPVLYVPTTQAFERAVKLAKGQPAPSSPTVEQVVAPATPEPPKPAATSVTEQPVPRTVADLAEGERASFLIDLAHFFEEKGGTATKYKLAEFLRSYSILLIAPASRLWLQNHNFIEVASTGEGGKAGRWKVGAALMNFIEKIDEAPTAACKPTALEELEELETKCAEVKQRALAELEAKIGELNEKIKQLEDHREALRKKKEELMR